MCGDWLMCQKSVHHLSITEARRLIECFVNGWSWWDLLWRSHGVVVVPCGWGCPWVVAMFSPGKIVKKCHEDAVKRIVCYLKGTHDKGLIFEPTGELNLGAFMDADSSGLWGVEEPQNATCVKSRTGYVIRLGGSLLVWKLKLQTLVMVSTMEAEYVALSACMRKVIPLRHLLLELQSVLSFKSSVAHTACTVFEDNQGVVALAKVPTMTPRSKPVTIPYHFFREYV